MKKALFDADVLRYQVGFAAEAYWKMKHLEEGIEVIDPPPFDVVADMLENRIANSLAITEANSNPVMIFTGSGNFRNEISTTGYKKRTGNKPFHYKNIEAYLKGAWDWEETKGIEADDLLSIKMTKDPDNTIIIGVDKDLLQVPGWHYLFEYGSVPSFGPLKVEGYGRIWLDKKLRGYGLKFFLAQCIMGDPVDSIIGIPKSGPAKAFKLLGNTKTYLEGLEAVLEAYKGFYGDSGEEKFIENARLLWMVRELTPEGTPVMWELGRDYEQD